MSTSTLNKTNSLKIDGMTCINCAINLEKSVMKTGLKQVHVNFANKELIFENDLNLDKEQIAKAIRNAGFSIAKEDKANQQLTNLLFVFSLLLAAYFILIMFIPVEINPWIDFALAGIALAIGFWKFGKGAFYSIRSGSANMYVLILLGATTAFLFSLYLQIFQANHHLFYETTAVLIALVLVGDILEQKAIEKTLASISGLASNKVSQAKKIVAGSVELLSINALKVGDFVQGNLGDEIHTDAIVTEGTALVNEALITGESEAIKKNIGDLVLGGSEIIDGNIIYQVQKNAHLSTKSKINQLVQSASSKKANVQKLADRISGVFVPLILVITVLSFLMNYYWLSVGLETAILRSIAILVISCPCAMGLATPIAIMVGLGKMSNHGILVKTPNVFENFAKVERIIFDKTGTLTTGKFVVKDLKTFNHSETEIKALIGTLESKSSHPIAQSIAKLWVDYKGVDLEKIEEIKGKGMIALDREGAAYKLGSPDFTNQNSADGDIFLLKNGKLIASLKIEDELKANAKSTLNYFNKHSVKSIILSGDKKEKCIAIAKELATDVIGELKPEDKLDKIDTYGKMNTAMLGDGINDAPSLAKVNVGISFAEASNMAMQSADVILMQDDMNALQKAHKIAKLTYQTIRQNLFWAFAYNLVAIPLAAFGIINPMLAAFFMIFSDLIVVGNAFILKGKKV